MPRAPNERPARRLDAILDTLRRHGVRRFEAAQLEGIGTGLKWTFADLPPAARGRTAVPGRLPVDPDLADGHRGAPIDELALVEEARSGPVPGNGVS